MGEITRVHHLDCCTMCPVVGHIPRGHLVAHVLALETESAGIVLVDTGIGEAARAAPSKRLGAPFAKLFRPDLDPARTARAQVRALGLDPADVRHIVVTHLDPDHAGGLADFPEAIVHVHATELDMAVRRPTLAEKGRYRPILWDHGPRFRTYEAVGEAWYGFDAVHDIEGLPPEILAIPMPGHTHGHALVAVDGPDGWLLHCGDAYFDEHIVRPAVAPGSKVVRTFEQMVAVDRAKVARNHDRLRDLDAAHGESIAVFSAHDAREFERMDPSSPP
jgi:glyoxylase-like metal-dependent hydrolase (beta-lactamase superfamily II)